MTNVTTSAHALETAMTLFAEAMNRGDLDSLLARTAWRLTGTGPDGSALEMAHESTDVARLQPDGSWKFVIDHPFGADPL